MAPDLVVDCLGRPCPVPVIELAKAVRDAPPGTVVAVRADDPAARHDVPAWCRLTGADYLGELPGPAYAVRAGGPPAV